MSLYLGTQKVKINLNGGKKHAFLGRPDYLIFDGKLVFADPKIYLQSSGTQYIDTGFTADGESGFDIRYHVTTGNNGALYGARAGYRSRAYMYLVADNYRVDYGNIAAVSSPLGLSKGRLVSGLENNNVVWRAYDSAGTLQQEFSTAKQTFTTPASVALYAKKDNDTVDNTKAIAKIYYFKIYDADELKHHFVPVPQGMVIGDTTISAPCMFDIVTQTPFYNDGTGDFVYGKDN